MLLLSVFLTGPASAASGWWNDDWNFRKEITLDSSVAGANIGASVADVPVLIRLHTGNFGYFGDTKPDGSDIRFVASDDKTPLKFHIERYDPKDQFAFIWVHVPQLAGASNAQKILMYYGNPKAPSGDEAAATYDKNQVLVLHFNEKEGVPADSSAYASKVATSTAEFNPASLIGGGVKLSGKESIAIPSTPALRFVPQQGVTVSAWVKVDAPKPESYVFAFEAGPAHLTLGVENTHVIARAGAAAASSGDVLVPGQWHHVLLTAGQGRMHVFVDAVEAASAAIDLPEIAGTLTIGAASGGDHAFEGEIDEAQVSNIVRTPEWIQSAVRTQGQQANLLTYGNDAQREGQKVSYFKVTMQNVTPDGWVVIIILAVMFVISMLLMIAKTFYLMRVRTANAGFLKEFEALRGDYTSLDKPEGEDGDAALNASPFMPHMSDGDDKHQMSTIYRLYHHGVQEMTGRVGLRSAGASAVKALTPQAMAAIRATMDASSVRLTQKLQSKMVLLTIAISGGPFLGLLGTVVGVMITFAAIAASGDVNVNSIAPGIAAALAATVAGLAVAIPALFGYNWLNTIIKEINADMRVFIDEFVTRVAEYYS